MQEVLSMDDEVNDRESPKKEICKLYYIEYTRLEMKYNVTVAIDLKECCLTHGQLYVALSRSRCKENQYILIPLEIQIENIVHAKIL